MGLEVAACCFDGELPAGDAIEANVKADGNVAAPVGDAFVAAMGDFSDRAGCGLGRATGIGMVNVLRAAVCAFFAALDGDGSSVMIPR